MDVLNKIKEQIIGFGMRHPQIFAACCALFSSLLIISTIPQSGLFTFILVFIINLAILEALAYILVQSLNSKVQSISYVMDRVKNKDFNQVAAGTELSGMESFITSFNNMVSDLKSIITYLKAISKQLVETSNMLTENQTKVTQAIDDISSTMTEIAQGASEQASEAEKGVNRITDLSEQINKVSVNTLNVVEASNTMRSLSIKGLNAVETLKNTSEQSKKASAQTMSFISSFIDKTKNIGEFVSTINTIAEQTNLLALNAAIEAARAGESGRGFAVVADEVRKLADASKKATERVEEIMFGILSDADKASTMMESIKNVMSDQNSAVENTNNTFNSIADSIENIVSRINSVSQTISIMEKNKNSAIEAIQNISAVTQQAAASSQEVASSTIEQKHMIDEMASSSKNLNELSLQLRKFVDTFKI